MVMDDSVYIIMPVKDSIETAEQAIHAVVDGGYRLTVYDDYSNAQSAKQLDSIARQTGIEVIHLNEYTNHPSPNYRWVLIDAQRKCLETNRHLVIIESDVTIDTDTIDLMKSRVLSGIGLVASATKDDNGRINFPYEYARKIQTDGVCKKRLSFCCTLLTQEFMRAYNFEQLDSDKNWYDVHISHVSREMGFTNILLVSHPVLHKPHSSRPWKQLKYTNPLLYYWRKLTQGLDKI